MIKFIITGQQLSIVTAKVVSGTHNYLEVEASFRTSDWTGLRKWAHFTMGDYNYIMPFTDDKIASSLHLDLTEGTWEVYVHGNEITDDEVTERITTDIKYLYVDAPHDGHPFPPLTPDVEEMLANEIEEAIDIAQSVRDDADAGEFDGATFTPSVNSTTGDISWTNDKGKENPPTANIKGPKGDVGDTTVQVSTTEPTDPRINVWINPDGQAAKLITSFALVSGTHQPGTYDTYKVTFTEGADLTFTIYNGADGEGSGDMLKSVYDSANKAQDVFTYADTAAAGVKDTTAISGLLKGSSGSIVAAVAGTDYQEPITIDSAMSASSTNAVQNKIIKAYVDAMAESVDGKLFVCSNTGDDATTYAEIEAAVAAGKIPALYDAVNGYVGLGVKYVATASISYYCFPCFNIFPSTVTPYLYLKQWMVNNNDYWFSTTGNIKTLLETDVTTVVSQNETKPVSSGAVYSYVQQNKTTVDSALSSTSANPVQNKVIYQELQNIKGVDIETVTVTESLTSAMAANAVGTISKTITRTGYTALGVVGVPFHAGVIFNALVTSDSQGNDQLLVSMKNLSGESVAAGTSMAFRILYKKN